MSDDVEPWWKPLFRDLRRLEGEESELAMLAYTALLEGDLLPLASFLRAGYDLHPMFRMRLVEMIEGENSAEYIVSAKKVRQGPGNQISRHRARARQMQVATFVRENRRSTEKMEATVQAACDEFNVSRAYVFEAVDAAKLWDRAISIDLEPLGRAIESIKLNNSKDR